MKLSIVMAYRPTCGSNKHNRAPVWQDENFKWWITPEMIKTKHYEPFSSPLENCVKAIRKNSVYHHKIIVSYEPDVYFNEKYFNYIKNTYDVTFFKNKPNYESGILVNFVAMADAFMSLPDNEMVLYAYSIDCICGKYWDRYIKEAHDTYGDDVVYNSMWIEPRTNTYVHANICGPKYAEHQLKDLSTDNIWNLWRKGCCHSLSMQFPIDKEYIIEKDLDDWSAVCNAANKGCIVEPCGARDYGYWCLLIARNKIFKDNVNSLLQLGPADLRFEESLGKNKVVVTKSHVFHLHSPCKLDNIEVEHIK